MPLPRFLTEGGAAEWPDILDGLRITGHFLERDLLTARRRGRAAGARAAGRSADAGGCLKRRDRAGAEPFLKGADLEVR